MDLESNSNRGKPGTFAALRRFSRPKTAEEQCDLCSTDLPAEHQHLLDPVTRQLLCACDACALLFSSQAGTRYLRVPRDIRALPQFKISDATWDGLLIPVGMAFFFFNTRAGKVTAYYPSPAGAIESLLSLETWDQLVQDNPILGELQPDVEALLVNRLKNAREYYLAPIDKCYELVGLIRIHWRGLSGGSEAWNQIAAFFNALKARSTGRAVSSTPGGDPHA